MRCSFEVFKEDNQVHEKGTSSESLKSGGHVAPGYYVHGHTSSMQYLFVVPFH